MKRLKFTLTLLILTSFIACDPPVTFNEPQPTDSDNLSKFPNRLQGQYASLADNSILSITDKSIQRIYDYDLKVHQNEIDSGFVLSGDTAIDINTSEKFLISRDGDSLVTHIHYIDTLFQLDNDNVLRKLKGYYFLNTAYNQDSWEVKKVQLSKGQLTISGISTELDIENLSEITETPQDTVPTYHFSTTKKQFKEFVKNDGFRESETFVRQKKNAL